MWPTIVWSQLEFMLGIICGCVPLMRPIFGKFFTLHRTKGTGSYYQKMPSNDHPARGTSNFDGVTYPLKTAGTSTVVQAGKQRKLVEEDQYQLELEDNLHRPIRIKKGWDVQNSREDVPVGR